MKTPAAEYLGSATVISRAEFARLIRKAGYLFICLHIADSNNVAQFNSSTCGFRIPANQAIDKLGRGDFDAFTWEMDDGPSLFTYTAPMALQLQRRGEILRRQIADFETRDATWKTQPEPCRSTVLVRESWRADTERRREELHQITAKITANAA